jgi:hypothetical protein
MNQENIVINLIDKLESLIFETKTEITNRTLNQNKPKLSLSSYEVYCEYAKMDAQQEFKKSIIDTVIKKIPQFYISQIESSIKGGMNHTVDTGVFRAINLGVHEAVNHIELIYRELIEWIFNHDIKLQKEGEFYISQIGDEDKFISLSAFTALMDARLTTQIKERFKKESI